MDREIKELLKKIISNQTAIYKRLEDIEYRIKGGGRSASSATYFKELKKESDKYLPFIENKAHDV